ncbi:LCP family protein [Clostridium sp. CS001]|uniref:LCP family protein n=1 Tax=Clostridium sp. CS001 TaxID=2880648 RepID=UPI001CF5AA7B|nr:LCP family protein [Clostridium sp. CS001]MCB2288742.1 LCP family protein [Clostridium sp. CS001]
MKKERKRKKIVNYKRFATVTITFVVISFALIFAYFYFYLSNFNNNAVDLSSNLSSKDIEQIKKTGKSCNILIMGVDVGTPGSVNANDPKRTDTLIVAHYNAEDGKINLVSIPRDILININGKNQKINAAHAIGGVKYAVAAVEKLLSIKIDYYGKVDYEGFRKVIDAIGGIDMDITRNMNYDDPTQNLSIHFKKDTTVHLDGKKAEEFFRWRKNNDGTGFQDGDLGRIENQHMFIGKVMDKVKNPLIVLKIPGILSAIQDYVEVNMDGSEIMKYGYIFASIGRDKLSMDTLKGDAKYISGISYLIYDEDQNKEIVSKLQDSNVKFIDKSNLNIKVINGTKKPGLASDFKEFLAEKGYSKVTTENGPATSKTKIEVYKGDKEIEEDLKKDFKIDNIEFLLPTKDNFDMIVILGEDHEYIK